MPVEIMAQLGNESNVSQRILSKKDFYLTWYQDLDGEPLLTLYCFELSFVKIGI